MLQETLQPAALALLPAEPTATDEHREITDLAALHALYAPRVFRFLLLSTRDHDLAQSLTQDTFLKLWRTRDSFRGHCSLSTWITRIAVSLLRSHTRTKTFRFWRRAAASALDVADLAAHLPDGRRSPESLMLARESLAQLWRSVEQLSPRQRSIFLLRYIEEMDLPEIAHTLDLSLPTVKSHLYRALDRLRDAHAASTSSSKGASKS